MPHPAEGNEPHQPQKQHEQQQTERAGGHPWEQRGGDGDRGKAEEAGGGGDGGRVALGPESRAGSGALTLLVEPAPAATELAAE